MQYYDGLSSGYDELHSEEQLKKAELIKKNCSLKGLLLDVGAGTGVSTNSFRENAECIALDLSKEMLKKCPGLKVVARAEELPFREASFESIVSLTALHHTNLPKAVGEIKRVAKPNAAIAISFFKRAKNFGQAEKLFSGWHKLDSEKDIIFLIP